jgi:capsular exopolysaccharide synthesis family protein
MSNYLQRVSATSAHAIEPVEASSGAPLFPRHHPFPATVTPAPESDWARALIVLHKNWKLAAVFMIAVFASTALVTLFMKPIYEPEAKIEIDPPGREIFSLQANADGSADAEYLETQAQKLQSDELAVRVIRDLHLDQNPEFAGKLAHTAFSIHPASDPADAPTLTPAESAALRTFRGRLSVRRDTSSRLVFVKFASHDPVVAATVTNTLISQYVERSYETRHKAIADSSQWLSRELDDVRAKMQASTNALADFQKQNGVADVGDNKSTLGEQMGELDRQLGQAQADRIQAESFLHQLKQSGAQSLPQVRDNPVMQSLIQKRDDVSNELAQASVIYGPNHPNVKKLRNQLTEFDREIASQTNAIVSQLKTTATAAAAREKLLSRQIDETTQAMNKVAQYNNLKREAQANEDLYNNLYAKIKEAGISAASKSNNVRVVDPARVLDRPTRPRVFLNLAGALAIGLVGGIFIAFGKERLENRLHTVDDVRRVTGLSSIAAIPEFTSPAANTEKLLIGFKQWQIPLPKPWPANSADARPPAEKFLLSRPNSPESEAMRALYTSITLSRPENPPKTILIASAFQGEGKTTVATNLAIALARRGKTLLIDADLRRPGVAPAFGMNVEHGLCDVLQGTAQFHQVVISNAIVPDLHILPAGLPSSMAAELSGSATLRELLAKIRSQFEHIVIDSPPILAFSDARAISPLVDGVVLVGRSGATTRQALTRTIELLAEVHSAPVLDVVLNAASTLPFPNYGYAYGYGYAA